MGGSRVPVDAGGPSSRPSEDRLTPHEDLSTACDRADDQGIGTARDGGKDLPDPVAGE
jgi:hypothetical protein